MSSDPEEELVSLRARVASLEKEVTVLRATGSRRERIQRMSAEVIDTNPYRFAPWGSFSDWSSQKKCD